MIRGYWLGSQIERCSNCFTKSRKVLLIEYGDQNQIRSCSSCAESLKLLIESALEDARLINGSDLISKERAID